MSGWVILHWFELGTLVLLCLNLWFVSAVLNALRETNRWIAFLSRALWEEPQGSAGVAALLCAPPPAMDLQPVGGPARRARRRCPDDDRRQPGSFQPSQS